MKKLLFALLLCSSQLFSQTLNIIPQPVRVRAAKGSFALTRNTVLLAKDASDLQTADLFNHYLREYYGFQLPLKKTKDKEVRSYISFTTLKFIKAPEHEEGYSLDVTGTGISISGNSYAGTFYGMQTLIQLLPVGLSSTSMQNTKLDLPVVSIQDYPRFSYRGMHLDVGRHFFPPSFIKKYIDYLALHKINYFHWHLTEDQGWRIEIKKYPQLTATGAWRNGTIVGRYPGTGNDNVRYGGYYTQEEAREIVKYAMDRHITVIPEIEMPGHSSAAIAAYPRLSCFPAEKTFSPTALSISSQFFQNNGGNKIVQETWGVFDDVYCAGKDSTFYFLQDVLDEIISIFPSGYIHIGGDECPKANWKRCPNCQARMRSLGLKDEHQLQSYFIQRMEKYINSKGRQIIGWNEILEGGLAPNATVMSWQGEKGGIAAAREKHNAIMCPEEFTYLNWSQTRYEDSVTFGRFTPIEKVYDYEPVPKELSTEEAKYILGIQGNAWSEYMKFPTTVEYNVFPRMSAIAETGWSPKANKNWKDFSRRLLVQFKRYERWKAHFSNAYFAITPALSPGPGGVYWKLSSNKSGVTIHYKLDDQKSRTYTTPLLISNSATAVVKLIENGKEIDDLTQVFYINKATGKVVTLAKQPMGGYQGQGAFSLVNGVLSNKNLSFPDWLGWAGTDMEATIDLGREEVVGMVKLHSLEQTPSSIYLPQYVEVSLSMDGISFHPAGQSKQFVTDTLRTGYYTISFEKEKARYVRVFAKNYGVIPQGSAGAGSKSLLFADEIQVF